MTTPESLLVSFIKNDNCDKDSLDDLLKMYALQEKLATCKNEFDGARGLAKNLRTPSDRLALESFFEKINDSLDKIETTTGGSVKVKKTRKKKIYKIKSKKYKKYKNYKKHKSNKKYRNNKKFKSKKKRR